MRKHFEHNLGSLYRDDKSAFGYSKKGIYWIDFVCVFFFKQDGILFKCGHFNCIWYLTYNLFYRIMTIDSKNSNQLHFIFITLKSVKEKKNTITYIFQMIKSIIWRFQSLNEKMWKEPISYLLYVYLFFVCLFCLSLSKENVRVYFRMVWNSVRNIVIEFPPTVLTLNCIFPPSCQLFFQIFFSF